MNQQVAAMDEILYLDDGALVLDRSRINAMLVAPAERRSKQYTPSVSQREERKRNTEAMHKDWQDAYQSQKREHPTKSATWISQQIAMSPIAQGKKAATIYRVMKG